MNHRPWIRPLLAALLAAAATGSQAVDLLGAWDSAQRVDPSKLAADEAVVAGREKAVQGRALLRPQIALSGSLTRLEDRSSSSLPPALQAAMPADSGGLTHQATLQLKQPVYAPKERADKRQLEEQTVLAETQWRHAQQDLMQRVGEAYFNVLLAEESLRVTRAELAAVTVQRDRAQARFEVGRGRITDVQEAQARHDSVLSKEVSAASSLALAQAQYAEVTGLPAERLAPLAPGFVPVAPRPDNLVEWQQRGIDANVHVLVKRSELAIADAEIGKHGLSGRPSVDLVARYGVRGQSGGVSPSIAPDNNRQASIGLQFNVPLYAGGALSSRERESIAKKRQSEQELAAAQRDARLQVQDAFLAVRTGVTRIAALEQSERSARTALEATTLGRDVGSRTELDVLDAQQRLFGAQLELAQARHDYLLGRLRLAFAAGALQDSDLRGLNAYLLAAR